MFLLTPRRAQVPPPRPPSFPPCPRASSRRPELASAASVPRSRAGARLAAAPTSGEAQRAWRALARATAGAGPTSALERPSQGAVKRTRQDTSYGPALGPLCQVTVKAPPPEQTPTLSSNRQTGAGGDASMSSKAMCERLAGRHNSPRRPAKATPPDKPKQGSGRTTRNALDTQHRGQLLWAPSGGRSQNVRGSGPQSGRVARKSTPEIDARSSDKNW